MTKEIELPGGFGKMEDAILAYLYAHPGDTASTESVAKDLNPEKYDSDRKQAIKETQHGIETLIVAKLIKGKRLSELGLVYHVKLSLTPKGEAEAIKQQRRVKKIILDIPGPQREK